FRKGGRLSWPSPGDDGRHHEAVGRITDRRLEEIDKRQLAETFRECHPRGYGARNRHRIPPRGRHCASALESLGRPSGRRAAGSVQPMQLAAIPEDRERITTDAVA